MRRVKNLAYNSTFKNLRLWYLGPSLHGKYMGEKVETVTYFIFLEFKITADIVCNHKIKRCLLLGRKAMTNILKSETSLY